MKKIIIAVVVVLWVISLVIAGIFYFEARHFLNTAPSTAEQAEDIIIDIEPGSSFTKVAEQLKEKGLITDIFSFKILAKYLESDNKLQAGRFKLSTAWLPQEVLEELVLGKPMYYRVTLREGLTWWEVAQILEAEGYTTFEDFKTIIHDPEFLRHWGIPFSNAEGFLYPDTYFLPKPKEINIDSARAVAGRLIDTFWRKTSELWIEINPHRSRPDTKTLKQLLILASIVEKETGMPAERASVAGVYTNRLQIGMLLQADPTVAYGLGPTFKPPLLRRHLEDENNVYNTYMKAGLPKGPICSPSLASLTAAYKPEKHNFLYFVATGTDGSHVFSTNLADHNKAVQAYRRTQRNK